MFPIFCQLIWNKRLTMASMFLEFKDSVRQEGVKIK